MAITEIKIDTIEPFAGQQSFGAAGSDPTAAISSPQFQALRMKMETEWVPQMMEVLDIEHASLPIIWDADFL